MQDPIHCTIKIKGHLSGQWLDYFEGLSIENQLDGYAVIRGAVPDQAALYGILNQLVNLDLPLLALNCARDNNTDTSRWLFTHAMKNVETK